MINLAELMQKARACAEDDAYLIKSMPDVSERDYIRAMASRNGSYALLNQAASPSTILALCEIAVAAHKMARKSCDMGDHTNVPTDDFDALMELLFEAFPPQPSEAKNE